MTERISLIEAYDNRDVIAQLVRLRDNVDELLNILKDIDPDGDLTNVVTKTGDQTIDGVKTFIGKIVADCDIIQNGSAYETHAEQVFTKNDLIVTREDAIGGIAAGQLSGIRVKKYDGVSDLNLGADASGVMRIGDVGDEQPLATRDEESDMTSGALVKWDGVNKKMIAPASNIGSDVRPVKIINGEEVPVAGDLQPALVYSVPVGAVTLAAGVTGTTTYQKYGNLMMISGTIVSSSNIAPGSVIMTFNYKPKTYREFPIVNLSSGGSIGGAIDPVTGQVKSSIQMTAGQYYVYEVTYYTED